MLAALNRRAENVRIVPMVVTELKFRDVQRHILGTDLVEGAHDAALENAPKAFNRVGVNRADDVTLCGVHHGLPIVFFQIIVNLVFIGCEDADIGGNHFADEVLCGFFGDAAQRAGDHVALAADSADHWRFTGACTARLAVMLFEPMPVCVFAADPRFVNFDDAAKLGFRLNERGADFVAHGMRGPVGAEAHYALHLQRADSLLAGQHQVDDAKPLAQRLVGVLKDGASDMREAVARRAARSARGALPVISRRQRVNLCIAAARAGNALRPAAGDQVGAARILIGERSLELSDCHLVNGFGAAHGVSSVCRRILP